MECSENVLDNVESEDSCERDESNKDGKLYDPFGDLNSPGDLSPNRLGVPLEDVTQNNEENVLQDASLSSSGTFIPKTSASGRIVCECPKSAKSPERSRKYRRSGMTPRANDISQSLLQKLPVVRNAARTKGNRNVAQGEFDGDSKNHRSVDVALLENVDKEFGDSTIGRSYKSTKGEHSLRTISQQTRLQLDTTEREDRSFSESHRKIPFQNLRERPGVHTDMSSLENGLGVSKQYSSVSKHAARISASKSGHFQPGSRRDRWRSLESIDAIATERPAGMSSHSSVGSVLETEHGTDLEVTAVQGIHDESSCSIGKSSSNGTICEDCIEIDSASDPASLDCSSCSEDVQSYLADSPHKKDFLHNIFNSRVVDDTNLSSPNAVSECGDTVFSYEDTDDDGDDEEKYDPILVANAIVKSAEVSSSDNEVFPSETFTVSSSALPAPLAIDPFCPQVKEEFHLSKPFVPAGSNSPSLTPRSAASQDSEADYPRPKTAASFTFSPRKKGSLTDLKALFKSSSTVDELTTNNIEEDSKGTITNIAEKSGSAAPPPIARNAWSNKDVLFSSDTDGLSAQSPVTSRRQERRHSTNIDFRSMSSAIASAQRKQQHQFSKSKLPWKLQAAKARESVASLLSFATSKSKDKGRQKPGLKDKKSSGVYNSEPTIGSHGSENGLPAMLPVNGSNVTTNPQISSLETKPQANKEAHFSSSNPELKSPSPATFNVGVTSGPSGLTDGTCLDRVALLDEFPDVSHSGVKERARSCSDVQRDSDNHRVRENRPEGQNSLANSSDNVSFIDCSVNCDKTRHLQTSSDKERTEDVSCSAQNLSTEDASNSKEANIVSHQYKQATSEIHSNHNLPVNNMPSEDFCDAEFSDDDKRGSTDKSLSDKCHVETRTDILTTGVSGRMTDVKNQEDLDESDNSLPWMSPNLRRTLKAVRNHLQKTRSAENSPVRFTENIKKDDLVESSKYNAINKGNKAVQNLKPYIEGTEGEHTLNKSSRSESSSECRNLKPNQVAVETNADNPNTTNVFLDNAILENKEIKSCTELSSVDQELIPSADCGDHGLEDARVSVVQDNLCVSHLQLSLETANGSCKVAELKTELDQQEYLEGTLKAAEKDDESVLSISSPAGSHSFVDKTELTGDVHKTFEEKRGNFRFRNEDSVHNEIEERVAVISDGNVQNNAGVLKKCETVFLVNTKTNDCNFPLSENMAHKFDNDKDFKSPRMFQSNIDQTDIGAHAEEKENCVNLENEIFDNAWSDKSSRQMAAQPQDQSSSRECTDEERSNISDVDKSSCSSTETLHGSPRERKDASHWEGFLPDIEERLLSVRRLHRSDSVSSISSGVSSISITSTRSEARGKKKSSKRVDGLLSNQLFRKHLFRHADTLEKRVLKMHKKGMRKALSNFDLSKEPSDEINNLLNIGDINNNSNADISTAGETSCETTPRSDKEELDDVSPTGSRLLSRSMSMCEKLQSSQQTHWVVHEDTQQLKTVQGNESTNDVSSTESFSENASTVDSQNQNDENSDLVSNKGYPKPFKKAVSSSGFNVISSEDVNSVPLPQRSGLAANVRRRFSDAETFGKNCMRQERPNCNRMHIPSFQEFKNRQRLSSVLESKEIQTAEMADCEPQTVNIYVINEDEVDENSKNMSVTASISGDHPVQSGEAKSLTEEVLSLERHEKTSARTQDSNVTISPRSVPVFMHPAITVTAGDVPMLRSKSSRHFSLNRSKSESNIKRRRQASANLLTPQTRDRSQTFSTRPSKPFRPRDRQRFEKTSSLCSFSHDALKRSRTSGDFGHAVDSELCDDASPQGFHPRAAFKNPSVIVTDGETLHKPHGNVSSTSEDSGVSGHTIEDGDFLRQKQACCLHCSAYTSDGKGLGLSVHLHQSVSDSGLSTVLACRKCDMRRRERKETIQELAETEKRYGRDLNILKEEFYRPMKSTSMLTIDQLDTIFANLEELIHAHKQFMSKLTNALVTAVQAEDEDLTTVSIGNVFLQASAMFLAFENYCVSQSQASLLLDQLIKEKELLRVFLQVAQNENPKLRRMHLKSFLMVPVQRVMKYPLLLSRLYKVTAYYHSDKSNIKQAQNNIENILEQINSKTSIPGGLRRRPLHLHGYSLSDKIEVNRVAIESLGWPKQNVCDVVTSRLWFGQLSEQSGWGPRKAGGGTKNVKFSLVHAVLLTHGREPLLMDRCVVTADSDYENLFEVHEQGKETFLFKGERSKETTLWTKQLKTLCKNLGYWRRRRNGVPNIMLKAA
ncbi:myosin-M heavy chain [Elysia marginata]|uniref:Myosin-M heavy chain n=1 Tax=Elysia marginata TaxID=1093978 RepID=A0AAV4EEA6_9GAST|nr:myosin-M heavy chain [Elysia marginata]